ncbi:ATP-binding cassette domain-containing protein [Jidongwangia harbinensis]|uniref:ATP-binding cassette domain-containing protein n=1 Tax=Jidongwangia harbinensis TaxID=2878561 RepID=UPI001CD9B8F7|nr:ATP-binding cassette domain-containing protein [Jidongwangia harbinensis]MCA2214475.1 ATP-binding cassette domain-containing protein [Jidongwangia harbinensis]
MTYAIEATGLVKRYGDVTALNGVDLAVPAGSVLGVLGPNGAGKTTAVRILATLLRPDAGTARIGGYDLRRQAHEIRLIIGLAGQYASVDEDLSGLHNLTMVGRLLGLPRAEARRRADDLLAEMDLADAGGRSVKTYSGGMRRRLDLAASLVNRPAVLFLDEPTSGLDPAKRNDMWASIRALANQGSTVLLTTQYLEEADHLADDIVVIDAGRVVAQGSPGDLKRRAGTQTLDIRLVDPSRTAEAAALVAAVVGVEPARHRTAGHLSVPVTGGALMPAVIRRIDDAGVEVAELALRLPSLDDVFLALTGHTARTLEGTTT